MQVEHDHAVTERRSGDGGKQQCTVLSLHNFAFPHTALHSAVTKVRDNDRKRKGTILYTSLGYIKKLHGSGVIRSAAEHPHMPSPHLAVDPMIVLSVGEITDKKITTLQFSGSCFNHFSSQVTIRLGTEKNRNIHKAPKINPF